MSGQSKSEVSTVTSGAPAGRLKLGHISYSNCFPIHSRFLDRPEQGDPELIVGVPSALNQQLAAGEIDVAPCSSIEYARNADRYRILPDLVIGARGAVHSIIFLADRDPRELNGATVAIPSSSATSVVLLRILLKLRWKADVDFRWFDQRIEDPFADGASAALFIGDVALQPGLRQSRPLSFDLGEEWLRETDLPFAFAVWQANSGEEGALTALHGRLIQSRDYGMRNRIRLADRYSQHFGMASGDLLRYWEGLVFELDGDMENGLRRFYELAGEIGELPKVPELRWIGVAARG